MLEGYIAILQDPLLQRLTANGYAVPRVFVMPKLYLC